jgi:hypothetical protein
MDKHTFETRTKELVHRAALNASDIDTSKPGQVTTAASTLLASGSLAYFLGENSAYFTNPVSPTEGPLYTAFLALAFLAAKDLTNVCGRRATKTMLAGSLSGATTGLGTGLSIAGMALGLIGDIVLCGGLSVIGLVIGYFFTREGRKMHSCGAKLRCNTWICTRCKRIISPSRHWRDKPQWNILDACDFLDTGGFEWDTLKALAYLDYSGLLAKPNVVAGSPALWDRQDIMKATADDKDVQIFADTWERFRAEDPYANEQDKDIRVYDTLFESWQRFHGTQKVTSSQT